ncbi:MAG TPA: peptide ABC transporter substrate-binding protein [Opitutaceae bacterium]|nr:peptide ABC transporter substrate-binding protein [Opitutaceae bacterium]HND60012.1 peptide ABC transporter substrate-binding protein [Opitutaceae bacterium]
MIRRLALALLALAAVVFPGCARRETPVEEGIRTKTLLIGNQSEPATLDPNLIDAATDQNIATALFEGLTVLDEKTALPLPGVAERWEVSADGLEYTFHLRATARWSNGDPVTAEDFAYSFRRILTPALASVYGYMLWPIRNAEAFNTGKLTDFSQVGVRVVDARTLHLTLAHPTPYLLALAAHSTWMPVHRATIEKFGKLEDRDSAWTRPGNLVGNGPFTLTEWRPNARLVVTRNPHYWDDAHNHLERVIFFPTEKADVEEHNFRAGQVHLTYGLPSSKVAVYAKESPQLLRLDPLLSVFYISFNTTKPPFTDARVRRALALCLDRPAISQSVYAGSFRPADTLVPPDCGGYPRVPGLAPDYAAARALLAEAGFPGGRGLPPLPMQVLNDDKNPRVAEALQARWRRELGVAITIEPYEQKTWLQNQQTLSHTLGIMGWTADFADPITFLNLFTTNGGNNWTGWGSPAYDQLIARANQTADAATRFALLQEAESLLLREAPIVPVLHGARTYLIHPSVHHWEPSPVGIHRYQLVELK